MIEEEEYLKAKKIVQDYEQLNLSIIPSFPKIRVHYMTEFSGEITTLELDELLSFIKKFTVISIDWQ